MTLLDRMFRRRRVYDDLSAEIGAHVDEKVDDLVAAGMSRADALAAARRRTLATASQAGRRRSSMTAARP